MKKKYPFLLAIAAFFLFFSSCKKNDKKEISKTQVVGNQYYALAEFDKQESVWVAFPNVDHVHDLKNSSVTAQIITSLLPFTKVNFLCPSDSALQIFKPLLPDSIWKNERLAVHIAPYQEFWMRDMGPVFLKNAKNERAILDLNFNNWGYAPDSMSVDLDETLDERLAQKLKLPIVSNSMFHEGGDTELNGKGMLIVVEAVEKQRNPNMSLEQMEAVFKKTMGVKKVIWLKEGVREDDFTFESPIPIANNKMGYTLLTTGGHIDEFCRFVNPTTVLLAQVDSADLDDPIAQENLKRLAVNEQILRSATDQDGKPLTIIRMPMPKTYTRLLTPKDWVYDAVGASVKDKTPFLKKKPITGIIASSYLNFLIANGVVLAQKYYKKGMDESFLLRDEQSLKILQSVFPDRKIIQLDATSVNWGGGGVHCITANGF
jgi:agmatine deiminase